VLSIRAVLQGWSRLKHNETCRPAACFVQLAQDPVHSQTMSIVSAATRATRPKPISVPWAKCMPKTLDCRRKCLEDSDDSVVGDCLRAVTVRTSSPPSCFSAFPRLYLDTLSILSLYCVILWGAIISPSKRLSPFPSKSRDKTSFKRHSLLHPKNYKLGEVQRSSCCHNFDQRWRFRRRTGCA